MPVEFKDNSVEVKKKIGSIGETFLHEACGEIVSQTARNSKVSTGETKGSYRYHIDTQNLIGYIGSNLENAVWEEYGTGEYAVGKNGRKGGWWIKVGSGKGEIAPATAAKYGWEKVRRDKSGNITFVFTRGKKAQRPFYKAYAALKSKIISAAQQRFGGMK